MPRVPRLAAIPFVALATAAVLVLTGCAASPAKPAPKPSATRTAATPSASATSAGEVRVVIDADGVTVLDASGGTAASVPFTADAATAASRLGTALDETPVSATVSDDACYPLLDEQSFGGLHIFSSPDGLTRPLNAQFYVTADAEKTGGGIRIELPSGQAVGDAGDDVIEANLKAPRFESADGTEVHYDVANGSASGDPSTYYGALALIDAGKLTRIDSPVFYARDC
ncbi:hypothetical protein [Schumannella soli]|uniref:Uncharacterized protein n=1 Tax=Schumannella soli TaxID=2590779 RepID=A0A506XTT3_9MICO|nr:hypothetical protein [Schumannella soli]TPW76121.1 hypothetical protein FJ657_09920 [Schumannella soli]